MVNIDGCYHGLREDFLDCNEIACQLPGWEEAYPEVVRLESLGRSPEGRKIWLPTTGPEPERV